MSTQQRSRRERQREAIAAGIAEALAEHYGESEDTILARARRWNDVDGWTLEISTGDPGADSRGNYLVCEGVVLGVEEWDQVVIRARAILAEGEGRGEGVGG